MKDAEGLSDACRWPAGTMVLRRADGPGSPNWRGEKGAQAATNSLLSVTQKPTWPCKLGEERDHTSGRHDRQCAV